MTLLCARAYGVARRPRATFRAIVGDAQWAPILAVTTALTFVCTAGFLQTSVGNQALVDQWERTSLAFGRAVDDAAYASMEQRVMNPFFRLGYALVTTVLTGPVAALALAAVLYLTLNKAAGRTARFRPVLAVVSYSGVILAIRQLVATPIDYMRESIASPTTLLQFAGVLDEASPAARFLGAIDLFVLWWLVVLAIGLSELYARPAKRFTLMLAGAYMVIAVMGVLAMVVAGGTT